MLRRNHKVRKVDSPLYKYWQALYLAFFSSKFYIDVVKRWRGLGLKYLLFFLLIACIPYSIKSIISMNNQIKYDLLEPIYLTPKFEVKNGRVEFSKPMPYYIRNHEGKLVVIIDTTGTINHISDKYPDLLLLINSKKLYFRYPKLLFLRNDKRNIDSFNDQEIDTLKLDSTENEVFDGPKFIKDSNFINIKNYFLIFVYPIVVSGLFGMLLTVILAFAIMGQVTAYAIFKYRISYKQASRVSVIATTIGVGIYINLKVFDIYSRSTTLMCIAIAFMYFSYGILSVKRDSKHLVYY